MTGISHNKSLDKNMKTKLFVGNLSFDTTKSDLQELFSQAGDVREAALITDRESGRSRGFAFVTMADETDAQTAISKFNNKDYQGRSLAVNIARERDERPAPRQDRRPRRY
jgi:RNA recognition motif-containing protein